MISRAKKTVMYVALIIIFILSNVVTVTGQEVDSDDSEVPTQGIIGLKKMAFDTVLKESNLILEQEEPFSKLTESQRIQEEVKKECEEKARVRREEEARRLEKERRIAEQLRVAQENALKQAKTTQMNISSKAGASIQAFPHTEVKTYMAWHMCAPGTPQYNLGLASTPDLQTNIMVTPHGRYLAALGFAYADYIGQDIDVVMESGEVIPITVGDFKARAHTDQWNSASLNNGDIIEFIVNDYSVVNSVLNGSGSYHLLFPGLVKEFRILN